MTDYYLNVLECGQLSYEPAFELQKQIQTEVCYNDWQDVLLLLEHPHVYTLGRNRSPGDILLPPAALAGLGAQVVETNRGGKVTYHGPGQVVGYVIFDLRRHGRDVPQFVRNIEEAVIRTLAGYNIAGGRDPEHTGVWVGTNKICAIGISLSRWVTMHGFALNVNTDLNYFKHINPCGILDKGVTSMAEELGERQEITSIQTSLTAALVEVFGFADTITNLKLKEMADNVPTP